MLNLDNRENLNINHSKAIWISPLSVIKSDRKALSFLWFYIVIVASGGLMGVSRREMIPIQLPAFSTFSFTLWG